MEKKIPRWAEELFNAQERSEKRVNRFREAELSARVEQIWTLSGEIYERMRATGLMWEDGLRYVSTTSQARNGITERSYEALQKLIDVIVPICQAWNIHPALVYLEAAAGCSHMRLYLDEEYCVRLTYYFVPETGFSAPSAVAFLERYQPGERHKRVDGMHIARYIGDAPIAEIVGFQASFIDVVSKMIAR